MQSPEEVHNPIAGLVTVAHLGMGNLSDLYLPQQEFDQWRAAYFPTQTVQFGLIVYAVQRSRVVSTWGMDPRISHFLPTFYRQEFEIHIVSPGPRAPYLTGSGT